MVSMNKISTEQVDALSELTAIESRITPLWNLGRNNVLGWRPRQGALEILVVPSYDILRLSDQSHRILQGSRLMGNSTFEKIAKISGCEPLRFPFHFGAGAQSIPLHMVETILARYAITATLFRAVGLFDIVDYSKLVSINQVAQLKSLEYSINIAHKRVQDLGFKMDLARTTTGDGYYIWNRDKGPNADISTYLLLILALGDNAIALNKGAHGLVPELRVCFGIGPHYSFHQVEGLNPSGHDYIVGDITISLARMLEKCLPRQFLMGDFVRPLDNGEETIDSLAFVDNIAQVVDRFAGIKLGGDAVSEVKCYLTGQVEMERDFNISKWTITDKHGHEHTTYNQKVNFHFETAKTDPNAFPSLYLGRQHGELLNNFDANVEAIT